MTASPRSVVFVCQKNADKSQMGAVQRMRLVRDDIRARGEALGHRLREGH